ncbi:MAG: hypothetical protein HY812_20790 [Planctomycetes bacterium]|nr:hypothetical protein [Planctomycetota bacterium]
MPKKTPQSLTDLPPFTARDFLAFERHKWSDPEYNAERLELKRKLHAIGEALRAHLLRAGEDLLLRTSLHHPYVFNGHRVDSLWLYLSPSDKAKKPLRDLLGVEFAADTDASYIHANLVLEIDFQGLNLGLRVNERAWWDTQNAKSRCSARAGAEEFAGLLNGVSDRYALLMHDWKQEYRCGRLRWDDVLGYFRWFKPGVHRMSVVRSIPKGEAEATDPGLFSRVAGEFAALLPVYRFLLWSPDNNHLGLKGG